MLQSIVKIWAKYGFVFVNGLFGTLWYAAITVLIATVVGTIIAIMKLSKIKVFNWITTIYIGIIRGTPILLQLYFFYFMLPKALPFLQLSDIASILFALVINASAYVAEVIRAGIQAVDKGQTEAAKSLGLTNAHMMSKIILPQAVKNILPALGNEYISMVKQTSLASVFFLSELMTSVKTVQSATYNPIPPLLIGGFIYLVVTTVLTKAMSIFEKRLHRNE